MRPPRILWRSLLIEQGRLLALSTLALLGVAIFGVAVRPLAAGQVGPLGALQLMALAIVPMLQFTLPFAAAFATTLAYHRFSEENEAIGACAGGVSYRSLLVPGAVIALGVALLIGGLTHTTIPWFFQRMERIVKQDAARLLVSAIRSGESVEIQDILLHADDVIPLDPDPDRGVTERLVLERVVALNTDAEGRVVHDVTAERVEAWLQSGQFDGEPATFLTLRFFGAMGKQRGESLAALESLGTRPIALPDAIADKPKYLTTERLRSLRENPDSFSGVAARRTRLAGEMAQTLARDVVASALETEGRLVLTDALGSRLVVRAAGADLEKGRFALRPIPEVGGVELDWRLRDAGLRRQVAERAWLSVEVDAGERAALVSIDLENVETPEAEGARRSTLAYTDLRLANDPTSTVFGAGSAQMLADVDAFIAQARTQEQADALRARRDALVDRIERLRNTSLANVQARYAFTGASLLMTLLGGVVALRMREAMPLGVYLWAFFPALLAIIAISGGVNLMRDNPEFGLGLIWTGPVVLLGFTGAMYWALRRH